MCSNASKLSLARRDMLVRRFRWGVFSRVRVLLQLLERHIGVGWARLYLKKAGLLDAPKRGFLQITERGRKILSEGHQRIDTKFLERFPEFVAFKQQDSTVAAEPLSAPSEPSTPASTPFEMLEDAYGRIRSGLANELLETLQKVDPKRFEQIVIDLLVTMGYGGSRVDAGKAIGKTGDQGIDGIIKGRRER